MLPSALTHQKPGQQWAFIPHADPGLIAETLVALANAEGGTLVLGVGADGRLGTIFTVEEAADALMSAQRQCRPPVKTEWQQEQIPGGAVVLLRVDRSSDVHVLADGRVLVRKGVENMPADSAEIAYLLETVADYFKAPVTEDMIVWAYSGVRPLYDDHASRAQEATRDYVLDLDATAAELRGGRGRHL